MVNPTLNTPAIFTALVLSATSTVLVSPTVLAQTMPMLLAQTEIRSQQVQFQPGASSATIQDSITGYETVDYVLNAKQGQSMNVSMATNNDANYFNILAPGEDEVAMFNGSISGNQYEGTLPESGDYKIRVYMMRSAARQNEVASYRLEMIVTTPGNTTSSGDALVPGTQYNATGDLPCSMSEGQPTRSCFFGVTREGNGTGTVTVKKPDGRTRAIFFQNGRATGYDQSQADAGRFSAEKQSDLNIIHIGQERYEIPDVVIYGD